MSAGSRPERRALGTTTHDADGHNARAVERLLEHGYPIGRAGDHGASVSVYLSDPDGNGIELYYDRPRKERVDSQGNPNIKVEPFDPRDLLVESGPTS